MRYELRRLLQAIVEQFQAVVVDRDRLCLPVVVLDEEH